MVEEDTEIEETVDERRGYWSRGDRRWYKRTLESRRSSIEEQDTEVEVIIDERRGYWSREDR